MRDSVLNFIRVAANIILHSFRAAAPCWAAICLTAVILIVRFARMKKKGKKQDGNYGAEGISLGMCFGLLFGTTFGDNAAIGIAVGALVGLAIGMCVPRSPKDAEK